MKARDGRFYVDESKPWFQLEAGWPSYVPKNIDFPNINLYDLLDVQTAVRKLRQALQGF